MDYYRFLKPIDSAAETFTVKLGSIEVEPNPEGILSGDFTLDEITEKISEETAPRYAFGWKGDIDNWFACGGENGEGEYYGLY